MILTKYIPTNPYHAMSAIYTVKAGGSETSSGDEELAASSIFNCLDLMKSIINLFLSHLIQINANILQNSATIIQNSFTIIKNFADLVQMNANLILNSADIIPT